MAILKPEPNSTYSRMAASRLAAVSCRILPLPVGQVGVGPAGTAADAAPDLVELGKAQPVGILHDEGVDVGDVDAGLDDGGAHQHIRLAIHHRPA